MDCCLRGCASLRHSRLRRLRGCREAGMRPLGLLPYIGPACQWGRRELCLDLFIVYTAFPGGQTGGVAHDISGNMSLPHYLHSERGGCRSVLADLRVAGIVQFEGDGIPLLFDDASDLIGPHSLKEVTKTLVLLGKEDGFKEA